MNDGKQKKFVDLRCYDLDFNICADNFRCKTEYWWNPCIYTFVILIRRFQPFGKILGRGAR